MNLQFNSQVPHFLERVNAYCQKVLPLVFDNSLSYYEFLGKINYKLNEVIEALNAQTLNIVEFTHIVSVEIERFEKYMEDRQTNFENEMKSDWEAFKAEMNAFKEQLLREWAEELAKNEAFRQDLIQQFENFKTELNTQMQEFENKINADFENFKAEAETNFNNFKSEINNTIADFETEINNDFNGFKDVVNTELNDFKTEIRNAQTSFESQMSELFENWSNDEHLHLEEWKTQYNEIWNNWKNTIENSVFSQLETINKKLAELETPEPANMQYNVTKYNINRTYDFSADQIINFNTDDGETFYKTSETSETIENYIVNDKKINDNFYRPLPFAISRSIELDAHTTLSFNLTISNSNNNASFINVYLIPADILNSSFTLSDISDYLLNPLSVARPNVSGDGLKRIDIVTKNEIATSGYLLFYVSTGFDSSPTNILINSFKASSNTSHGILTQSENNSTAPCIFYPDVNIDNNTIKYDDDKKIYVDNTQINNDITINTNSIGLNRKNLLENTTGTKTETGVLFTVNTDGSVTAKRNEASESNSYYLINKLSLKKGKYIFTGGNSDDRNIPYILIYTYKADNTYIGAISGNTIFEVIDETMKYGFNINYPTGNYDEVTFYPMLRCADVIDDTYQAYTPSLQEQINNNNINISTLLSAVGLNKKNLLKITNTNTSQIDNITFTYNTDKTFTISGVNNSSNPIICNINNSFTLPNNSKYKLSGCPINENKCAINLIDNNSIIIASNNGNPTTFKNIANSNIKAQIYIYPNADFSNSPLTLKPMITFDNIDDSTYEPYIETLQEQINNILSRLTSAGI